MKITLEALHYLLTHMLYTGWGKEVIEVKGKAFERYDQEYGERVAELNLDTEPGPVLVARGNQ